MSEPLVFVSHFRVREGKLEDFRREFELVVRELEGDKPGTLFYAAYLNEDETKLTIFHVFGDAAAMDAHFVGAEARSTNAYQMIEPAKAEIFGRPSAGALTMLEEMAAELSPEHLGGFMRLEAS